MDVVKPNSYPAYTLYKIGIPLTILIILCSFFLWEQLRENEVEQLQQQVKNTSTIIINPIQSMVDGYVKTIARMGNRWDANNGMSYEEWHRDASSYLKDIPIFHTISYVDTNLRVKWIVPESANKYIGIDLSTSPLRNQLLTLARTTQHPIVSKIFTLLQGNKGFLIIVPLVNKDKFGGYIIASVDVKRFFQELYKEGFGNNFGIAIYQNNELVYTQGKKITDSVLMHKQQIRTFNIEWTIYIWPTTTLLTNMGNHFPEIVLAGGLVLALLMFIIFYFYNVARLALFNLQAETFKAENSIAKTELILETVNEGFLTTDQTETIIAWNPFLEKVLHWPKKEILGKSIYQTFLTDSSSALLKEKIAQFLQSGKNSIFLSSFEITAIDRKGNPILFEMLVSPLKIEDKYIYNIFLRDISARKKVESDQARLASIIENSTDSIVSVDQDGYVLTWNHGSEQLYGYTAEEMIGQLISVIYPEPNTSMLKNIMTQVMQGNHINLDDTIRKHKDGRLIPVSILISPLKDKKGQVIGAASIMRDLTERKKIQKMKDEFISIVSHELRTPLTSIRGSLGLLMEDKLTSDADKAQHLLKIANNNCDRLIRLINDMLDIEKIESGKIEFHFKLIDLESLINEVIHASTGLIDKYHIPIVFTQHTSMVVLADYDRIIQVITNLVSNAIRFAKPDSQVEIRLESADNCARVSVINMGEDIPGEFKERIFGKFSQADSSSTRKQDGSGLGLHISKRIIDYHQGTISYSHSNGKTIFYFDLPLNNHPKIENSSTDQATKIANVLSVEDDKDITYLISVLLQDKAEVWPATNIATAKELLKSEEFDLVILDLNLPDGHGSELLPCLNKRTNHPIPIIVFSIDELQEQYFHFVHQTLLKSKVTNKQLADAIESIINKKDTL